MNLVLVALDLLDFRNDVIIIIIIIIIIIVVVVLKKRHGNIPLKC
jgi:hypothetical protein